MSTLRRSTTGQRVPLRPMAYAAIFIALMVVLLLNALAVGVTTDPDPDGYVTYARHLQQNWTLLEWRRLPGYPALMALADSWLPWSIHVDMFYVHAALTVLIAATTTALVACGFGPLVGAIYLSILSINSFFVKSGMVMLADLPHVVVLWLAAAAAVVAVRAQRLAAAFGYMVFAVLIAAAIALHPSTHLRVHGFVVAAGLAILVRRVLDGARPRLARTLGRLALLSVLTVILHTAVLRTLQVNTPQTDMTFDIALQSSDNLNRWWVSYRMLLCLPPPRAATAFDLEIETIKQRIGARNGYATSRTTPPGPEEDFIEYFRTHAVPLDVWRDRAMDRPMALATCALDEMLVKYHTLMRGLTPFAPPGPWKPWVTLRYPPDTGSARDRLFWTTGLNLLEHLPADAPAEQVRARAWFEAALITTVAVLTLFGLALLEHHVRTAGLTLFIGSIGWFLFLSIALPIETRYFMPQLPALYLAQALALAWLVQSAGRAAGVHAGRPTARSV